MAPPRTVTNVFTQLWSYLMAVLFYIVGAILELPRFVWAGRYAISAAVFGLLLIGATVGTGYQPVDSLANDAAEAGGEIQSGLNDASSRNSTELRLEVHKEVNRVRAKRNLSQLRYSDKLQNVSQYHSDDMAEKEYFAHVSPRGTTVRDRLSMHKVPCSNSGENLLLKPNLGTDEESAAESIVKAWMNSDGHRENLLRPGWQIHSIGIAEGDDGYYITQNFC